MKDMSKNKTILSYDEVKHIAHLARLPLTQEEGEKFRKQLSEIIDLVGKLTEVDTKNVEPTSQVTGLENILREDRILPSFSQEEALSNAKRSHKGYFVVDAIFEE